jgi:flagellar basal-body rod modification protein FlgD
MTSITSTVGSIPGVASPALPQLQTEAEAASDLAQADKEVFLKLLVAQLQNQNPADPSDPMQFVAQLAQFTGVEQTIAMRKELESIRSVLEQRLITPETNTASVNGPETGIAESSAALTE